jgi:hypothetical protein
MNSPEHERNYSSLPWHLYLLTLDDYSPHALMGGVGSEPDEGRWQYAVDVIYRCLVSGLWELWDDQVLKFIGADSYEGLCEGLSRLNPFDLNEEGESYWLIPFMSATEAPRKLLSRFEIPGQPGEFSEGVVSEAENYFRAAGVSLDRGVLFPIRGLGCK